MGGNALAQLGVHTRRASAEEYHNDLVPDVLRRIQAALPGTPATVIPAYRSKPDFGDADILVNGDNMPNDWVGRILHGFATDAGPPAHVQNGPVLSFDHDNFQVDLIRYSAPVHDFAKSYFAWNDLGNLLGRVAHSMDFSFGHAGLLYRLRDPRNNDRVVAKLAVTQNFDAALRFLGYDPAIHAAGFDDLENIYRYVASSPYFSRAPFVLEKRSHRARTRDRKRPTYTGFLAWLETQPDSPLDKRPANSRSQHGHLERALDAFPGFSYRYDQALADHFREQSFREVYNGRVAAEITGLEGKELGRTMAAIVAAAGGPNELRNRILSARPTEIRQIIEGLLDGEPTRPAGPQPGMGSG